MASTYTSNSGIEKPGTGDQSGTWGTTVNTNMDIIDRAISGVVSISLSGTSTTLTTTDGSLTDGMYKVLVLAGSPTGTNTITISPNSQDKFYLVKNGSGEAAVFSQGTGANVTVPNGGADIIYADGAGSGAAVASIFANSMSFSKVNVTADTAAGDDAAIGYTSAEGLILTGQGSTNDVTIKNDADADVITIATGGTNVDIVGDVTAATVNADGDTSAGDNATMGYTSAEGLILTGQGSTNDVTIKNDADADVITIATGGTNVDIVGDVTAATVNADGDTSASDKAAMGYTAAEGLILTGQGSTNDVTIKNDADADVIEIPTGGTDVTVAGKLTAGKILLGNTDTDTSNTGSVTLDFSANQNFVLTFTGNVTLANPSTESVGQAGVIVCIQDGTGSRTLSLGSQFKTVGDAGITLSTAANAVDIVPYFVSAADSILIGAVQLALSGA